MCIGIHSTNVFYFKGNVRVDKSRSNYVAIMKYMSRGSQWLSLYCCEPFLRSIQDWYTELYTDCTMLHQPLSDSPLCILSTEPPNPALPKCRVRTQTTVQSTQGKEERHIIYTNHNQCQISVLLSHIPYQELLRNTVSISESVHTSFGVIFSFPCLLTLLGVIT